MARKRKRKPPELGLYIDVRHPASEERYGHLDPAIAVRNQQQDEEAADADGHRLNYRMWEMRGDDLALVCLRRGTDPRAAAGLLRKIADLVERHGHSVLNVRQGASGEFIDGQPEGDLLQIEYGDDGEIILPDIETVN